MGTFAAGNTTIDQYGRPISGQVLQAGTAAAGAANTNATSLATSQAAADAQKFNAVLGQQNTQATIAGNQALANLNAQLQQQLQQQQAASQKYQTDIQAQMQQYLGQLGQQTTGQQIAGQEQIAGTQAGAQRDVANINAATALGTAGLGADTARYNTDVGQQNTILSILGQMGISADELANRRDIADMGNISAEKIAQGSNQTAYNVAGLQSGTEKEVQAGHDLAMLMAKGVDADTAAAQIASQQKISGEQLANALQIAGLSSQTAKDVANTQAGSAKYAADTTARTAANELALKKQKFGQVFPLLQSQLAGLNQQSSGNDFWGQFTGGGNPFSPQAAREQINAGQAQNTATTDNQIQRLQGALANRGFGSQSPQGAMLATQLRGGNMQANSDVARKTGQDFKEKSANYIEQLYQDQLKRQGIQAGQGNSLLAALSNLAV